MIISTKNCVEECILYSLAYCDWLILAVFGPCGNSCFVKMINCFCQFVYFRKFLHPIVVLRNFRRLQTFFINGRRFNILLYAYKLAFMTSLSCKKFKIIFTLKRGHEVQLICMYKSILNWRPFMRKVNIICFVISRFVNQEYIFSLTLDNR